MRRDLATILPALAKARTLASLSQDVPRVVREPTTVEAVTSAIPAMGTVTQTIQPSSAKRRTLAQGPGLDARRRARPRRRLGRVDVSRAAQPPGTGRHRPEPRGRECGSARSGLHRRDRGRPLRRPSHKGTVLSVDPAEGTSLREGATITLVPSLGPPPVPVPDISGKTLEAATAALGVAGLKAGDVHRVYSDHVAEGDVINRPRPTVRRRRGRLSTYGSARGTHRWRSPRSSASSTRRGKGPSGSGVHPRGQDGVFRRHRAWTRDLGRSIRSHNDGRTGAR